MARARALSLDVYAFGRLLRYLLTGVPPHKTMMQARPPPTSPRSTPTDLLDLLDLRSVHLADLSRSPPAGARRAVNAARGVVRARLALLPLVRGHAAARAARAAAARRARARVHG